MAPSPGCSLAARPPRRPRQPLTRRPAGRDGGRLRAAARGRRARGASRPGRASVHSHGGGDDSRRRRSSSRCCSSARAQGGHRALISPGRQTDRPARLPPRRLAGRWPRRPPQPSASLSAARSPQAGPEQSVRACAAGGGGETAPRADSAGAERAEGEGKAAARPARTSDRRLLRRRGRNNPAFSLFPPLFLSSPATDQSALPPFPPSLFFPPLAPFLLGSLLACGVRRRESPGCGGGARM